MSIRTRNIHFTNWAKVIEALANDGITVANEEEARTFLTETNSDANPFYYYVGYIKDTQEIYTHGQFYDCSTNNSSGSDNEGGSGSLPPDASNKGGVILYDTDVYNANFNDVVLSQSCSNFTQLDICCCTDVHETAFVSVYDPDGSIFNVYSIIQEGGELILKSRQYQINSNTISPVNGIGGMCSVSAEGISTVGGNYIGIYKVIAY